MRMAAGMRRSEIVVVTLSGRGDKDVGVVRSAIEGRRSGALAARARKTRAAAGARPRRGAGRR